MGFNLIASSYLAKAPSKSFFLYKALPSFLILVASSTSSSTFFSSFLGGSGAFLGSSLGASYCYYYY